MSGDEQGDLNACREMIITNFFTLLYSFYRDSRTLRTVCSVLLIVLVVRTVANTLTDKGNNF